MRHLKTFGFAALIPAAYLIAGTASAAPGDKCEVTVDRSQPVDTYSVTKQVLENDACICYVYTGPAGQQSSVVENRNKSLQASGKCDDATVQMVAGGTAAGVAAAAGGAAAGIGLGTALPFVGVAAAAGAVAASNGSDSPGG